MQLSAKTQNACLAAAELACRHKNPLPVGLKTIAQAQNLSSQYLVQILLQLKRAGLVQSTRGVSGGYRLTRDPDQISLLDLVLAMDGSLQGRTERSQGANAVAGAFFDAWHGAAEAHRGRLADISLASIVAAAETQNEDMYYI